MGNGPRVLHVVEAFGGGVADAISSFVNATAHGEHHLLYALREGITVEPAIFAQFASTTRLPDGQLRRIAAVRAARHRLEPDIVHAHSSFAGFYVRTAISRHRTPVVYSPHCFSFERGDISATTRVAFHIIERVLAPNTSAFAACSERELALARGLGRRPAQLIVNVARIANSDAAPAVTRQEGDPLTISMTGRLAPQKGIATFARLAREMTERGVDVRMVWVGGGETALAGPLHDSGVEVTGWLDPHDVKERLRVSGLYVHTAEWEGFPVGLLEAVALGVPSLVLARPYAEGLPKEMTAPETRLADRVALLADDITARRQLAAVNAAALADHTDQAQSQQLTSLYERVTAVRTKPRSQRARTT